MNSNVFIQSYGLAKSFFVCLYLASLNLILCIGDAELRNIVLESLVGGGEEGLLATVVVLATRML